MFFSEREEEEHEQEDDSLTLLHKWDKLKAKEERAKEKRAEVGNDSDRSEALPMGMASALLHGGAKDGRPSGYQTDSDATFPSAPTSNSSLVARKARRSSYSVGYGSSAAGGVPSLFPTAGPAGAGPSLVQPELAAAADAAGSRAPSTTPPNAPGPSRRKMPVRRTATVADLGQRVSPSKPVATNLLSGVKDQGQPDGSGPSVSMFSKQSTTLLGGNSGNSKPGPNPGLPGLFNKDSSASSKQTPLGIAFGKGSLSGEKPAVVPNLTPSQSMRVTGEGEAVSKSSQDTSKGGFRDKLKRAVQRNMSRSNMSFTSPSSTPSGQASSFVTTPIPSPTNEWDDLEDAIGSPSNVLLQGLGKPGASRLSRVPQKEGSDIEESEMHTQTKGDLAGGSDDSETEGEGQHPGGKRRSSGPSAAEMQLMGVPRSASFKRSMHKGVGAYVRPLTTLPPFVPRLLKHDIATNEAKYSAFDKVGVRELTAASQTLQPSITDFQGAVMIADVKGFTQLTEILSKTGTSGVELLTNCMNNYFTRVMSMILAFDGDVVKFAGDSMIVTFAPSEEEVAGSQDRGLYAATARSMQCAHVLATRLGHMRMKMNGQVEPINHVLSERVVEASAPQESDLLRQNNCQGQPVATGWPCPNPATGNGGGPGSAGNRRHGSLWLKGTAPGTTGPASHSRLGPLPQHQHQQHQQQQQQQDFSVPVPRPGTPGSDNPSGADPGAAAAPAVAASAGSGVHPSLRSLETMSGTHPSQASSTAGSARSGSSRVQAPDGASTSTFTDKGVAASAGSAVPSSSAMSVRANTAGQAALGPPSGEVPLKVQPTSASAGSGESVEPHAEGQQGMRRPGGGAGAGPAGRPVSPGHPDKQRKPNWISKIIPSIAGGEKGGGVAIGGGGGGVAAAGAKKGAAGMPQQALVGQVETAPSSNSSVAPSLNSVPETESSMQRSLQSSFPAGSATSTNGAWRGSMASFNTSGPLGPSLGSSKTTARSRHKLAAAHDASSLWGPETGGFAKREVSVATRLNIPPPVRMLKPSTSRTTPTANIQGAGTSGRFNRLGTMNSIPSAATNVLESHAEASNMSNTPQQQALDQRQEACLMGSFTTVHGSGGSASGRPSSTPSGPTPGDADWHSKLQSLQSGLMGSGGGESGKRGKYPRSPSIGRLTTLDKSRLGPADQAPLGRSSRGSYHEGVANRSTGSTGLTQPPRRASYQSASKPRSSQDSGTYMCSPSPVDGDMLVPEGSSPSVPPPGEEYSDSPQDENTQDEPTEGQQGGPVYEWSDDSYTVDTTPAPSALKGRMMLRGRDYLRSSSATSNAHIDGYGAPSQLSRRDSTMNIPGPIAEGTEHSISPTVRPGPKDSTYGACQGQGAPFVGSTPPRGELPVPPRPTSSPQPPISPQCVNHTPSAPPDPPPHAHFVLLPPPHACQPPTQHTQEQAMQPQPCMWQPPLATRTHCVPQPRHVHTAAVAGGDGSAHVRRLNTNTLAQGVAATACTPSAKSVCEGVQGGMGPCCACCHHQLRASVAMQDKGMESEEGWQLVEGWQGLNESRRCSCSPPRRCRYCTTPQPPASLPLPLGAHQDGGAHDTDTPWPAHLQAWQAVECSSSQQGSFEGWLTPPGGWQGDGHTQSQCWLTQDDGWQGSRHTHTEGGWGSCCCCQHQQEHGAARSCTCGGSGGSRCRGWGSLDHQGHCANCSGHYPGRSLRSGGGLIAEGVQDEHATAEDWGRCLQGGSRPLAEGLQDGLATTEDLGGRRATTTFARGSHTSDVGPGEEGPNPGRGNKNFMKRMAIMLGSRKMNKRKNDSGLLNRGSAGFPSGPWDGSNPLIMTTHGSVSPEQASRTNSFNFLAPPTSVGSSGGGGGVMASKLQAGPGGQGFGPSKARDPIAEEVAKSTFSLKIMVSAGTVCVFHMGGNVDEVTDPTVPEVPRWEYFIGDRPLAPCVDAHQRRGCIAQLAAIEDHSEAGIVVLSREVLDLVQHDWDLEVLPDDVFKILAPTLPFTIPTRTPGPSPFKPSNASATQGDTTHLSTARKRQLKHQNSSQCLSAAAKDGERGSGEDGEEGAGAPAIVHEFSHLSPRVQKRAAGLLRMHVLGSVRSRIEAGHLDFINEIRPLTCIFLGFPSLLDEREGVPHAEQVAAVQFIVQSVQDVMHKWDGSFMQFRCDEKGFVGICAFGLPGHTHEDNASRSILAALDLMKLIKDGGHRICVGVTTGDLLCTCVGARKMRSEYTVFGDAINLSARLMMKSRGGMGDILCDDPTFSNARYKAKYEELEPLSVKGKKMPVVVFRVNPFDNSAGGGAPSTNKLMQQKGSQGPGESSSLGPPERPLVGRDAEIGFILQRATNMVSGMATGGAIVIEGNTGMGKTKLLMEVRKTLEHVNLDTITDDGKHAFHLFYGVADTANKTQKLHPWRRIMHDLFAVDLHRGAQLGIGGVKGLPQGRTARRRSSIDLSSLDPNAGNPIENAMPPTLLGQQLAARFSNYNSEWRDHLSELFDLPVFVVPKGGPTTLPSQPCVCASSNPSSEQHQAHDPPAPAHALAESPMQKGEKGQDKPRAPRHARQATVEQLAQPRRMSVFTHSSGSVAGLAQKMSRHSQSVIDSVNPRRAQRTFRRWSLAHSGSQGLPSLELPSVLPLAEPHLLLQQRTSQRDRQSVDPEHMQEFSPHTLLQPQGPPSSSGEACARAQTQVQAHGGAPGENQQPEASPPPSIVLPPPREAELGSTPRNSAKRPSVFTSHRSSDNLLPWAPGSPHQSGDHPVSGPLNAADARVSWPSHLRSPTSDSLSTPRIITGSAEHSTVLQQQQQQQQPTSTGPSSSTMQLPMPPPHKGPCLFRDLLHVGDIRCQHSASQQQGLVGPLNRSSRHSPTLFGSSGGSGRLNSLGSRCAAPTCGSSGRPSPEQHGSSKLGAEQRGSSTSGAVHGHDGQSGTFASGEVLKRESRPMPDQFRQLSVEMVQQHQHQHQHQQQQGGSSGVTQQVSSPVAPPLNNTGSMARPMLRMGSISGAQGLMSSDPATGPSLAPGRTVAEVGESGGHAQKKDSLNFVVHVIREFAQLYGPVIILLENLHEFDTWSWQLLAKVAEVLTPNVLVLATTRPNEPPVTTNQHHLHGKAALMQKVAVMYRHLLKLPTTSCVHLEPFTFQQTEALMQVVSGTSYPEQYVLAVMEKTGGMPLYTEKVTEFLCQKPWLADPGGEFTANVNKMIRNLNFQQVIIERMDRLKPGVHLTLKVASVMGQWVDLDILHRFYPINKSKDELQGHLLELERGNFLKPTDTEGVWEFNMVERDIVYEVIPHYQRRRLHAKLAQELEHTLEEYHVATLTTIAYHWNQACMGNEVTEVECALKAIEHWHRAAEAAYSGSLLMEALRLYQKAGQIAEVLGESMGDSQNLGMHEPGKPEEGSDSSEEGSEEEDENNMAGNTSFTAVGSAYRGQLNWTLISRIMRAQWEKAMASCCLGIVLQHKYESNSQLEVWETQDYFQMLTEHAIRGLMLLGTPDPYTVLAGDTETKNPVARFFCCCFGAQDQLSGWEAGVELQDQEITEIRDILLVLIIAAEHYSLQHDGDEYIRLLTFCKCVCKFLNKCSDSGSNPFLDIYSACISRIKHYKATRHLTVANEVAEEFSLSPVREETGAEYGSGWDEGRQGSTSRDGANLSFGRGGMMGVNRGAAAIMAGSRMGPAAFVDPAWTPD